MLFGITANAAAAGDTKGSTLRLESSAGKVTVKNASGKEVSYYILGAWDGDVDRGRIAYKAPLGQALVEHRIGEKVKLPELGECEIVKIEPLPAEMIKELSGD